VALELGCPRFVLNRHILEGRLPASRSERGHWYLNDEQLAIAKTLVTPHEARQLPCQSCYSLAELLMEFEFATPLELAGAIELHEGNVRKHLLHLAGKKLAIRNPDRSWMLTVKGIDWIGDHLTGADHVADSPPLSDSDEGVNAPG
jgi:hypothetical protein